jgi:hypothetical protein
MRRCSGPQPVRHDVPAERHRVVADDGAERAAREQNARDDERDAVHAYEDAVLQRAARAGVHQHDDRKRDRDDEQLCSREEGERETDESQHVVPRARCDERPVAEEDRPHERRVRRVLREQRRRQDEPRRECGHGGGGERREARAGEGACEQVGRPSRAGQQQRVERVRRGLCGRGAQRPEERREQQRIELAQRAVVDAVDHRHGRKPAGDALGKPDDLELVGHDGPARRAQRVVAGDARRDEHDRRAQRPYRGQRRCDGVHTARRQPGIGSDGETSDD